MLKYKIGDTVKKKKLKKKYKIGLVILIIVTISSFIVGDYVIKKINGEAKYLSLELIGDKEVVIKYKEDYNDPGATASYKEENLTQNIIVDTNINFEKIGTYEYNYKIKYKGQEKETKRIVKIIDDENPVIKLNGNSSIKYVQGNKYEDLGATATDNYDGDISNNIEVDKSSFDTETPGEYKIIYKVKDSSGNENSIERTVMVEKKPPENQKIPVLNYHFFYETWDENCHQGICLKMDRFREQLQYLKDNGYTTLTIEEFTKWMYGELEVPEKSVLITVDDGMYGTSIKNGNHLIPALEKYQVNATIFLITAWGDLEDYSSPYVDVQSHTHSLHIEQHCGYRSKVNCVSYDELLTDLKKSIERVGNNANSFCFPFYESTPTSIKAVKEAGFKIAFVGGYRKASRNDDKYKIPRYPIHDSITMNEFIKMLT